MNIELIVITASVLSGISGWLFGFARGFTVAQRMYESAPPESMRKEKQDGNK